MAGCINRRGLPGGITLHRLLVDLMTPEYFTSMPAEGILDWKLNPLREMDGVGGGGSTGHQTLIVRMRGLIHRRSRTLKEKRTLYNNFSSARPAVYRPIKCFLHLQHLEMVTATKLKFPRCKLWKEMCHKNTYNLQFNDALRCSWRMEFYL